MSSNLLVQRLANTAIRSVVLLARLLLMLLLARFLPVEDVGLFGLFFVTVNFGLMLAGFEFHAFSNREIVGAANTDRSHILFNQLLLYLAVYICLVPVSLLVFSAGLLPWRVYGLFLAILVLEHLSYEAYRLFVVLGRPLTASMISLMRGGIWVLALLLLFVWREDMQTLHTTLLLWLMGGILALLYSATALYRFGWRFTQVSLDIRWIKQGLKVALPFFIGTLAVRGVFTLDRYFVENLSGLAVVGVYTFYSGLCVALLGLIEAAILSFAHGKLISVANTQDRSAFSALIRRLSVHTLVATTALATAIYYLSTPLMQLLENTIYLEHLNLLKLLLVAFSLYILSIIPQYGLYAMRSDLSILLANIASLFAFLVSMGVLSHSRPVVAAVPESMIIAFGTMLIIKSFLLLRRSKRFFTNQVAHGAHKGP